MIEGLLEPAQAMTAGGWVPWLAGTLDPEHGQEAGRSHVTLFPTGAIRLAA